MDVATTGVGPSGNSISLQAFQDFYLEADRDWNISVTNDINETSGGDINVQPGSGHDWNLVSQQDVNGNALRDFNLAGRRDGTLAGGFRGAGAAPKCTLFLDGQAGDHSLIWFSDGVAGTFKFWNNGGGFGEQPLVTLGASGDTATIIFRLRTGKRFQIQDDAGNTIFEVREDGSIHGLAAVGAITWDL